MPPIPRPDGQSQPVAGQDGSGAWRSDTVAAPRYASQFLAQSTAEELLLECAAAGSAPQEWNVHTRLALSWPAARRLAELLQRAIASQAPAEAATNNLARLPRLGTSPRNGP